MPKRIERVFDQPKIREAIIAIGANSVLNQVEYLLHKLTALLNVSGNFNDSQIEFTADQLIQRFPNESIADFKLCFDRGATGAYGQIFRMDSIVLFDWMNKYLEEKYQVLEDQLMKEKESVYDPVNHTSNFDFDAWLKSIEQVEVAKPVRPMTEQEIIEEGQEKPKKKDYRFNLSEAQIKYKQHQENLRRCQEMTIRERHPEWSDEQVTKRLNEL